MNGGDDHGVGHLRVSVEQPVGFAEAEVDTGVEDQVVVEHVEIQDAMLRGHELWDLEEFISHLHKAYKSVLQEI